ncbi:MAG: biotin/lipoyl-containing protein [Bacteroidota bacterium]
MLNINMNGKEFLFDTKAGEVLINGLHQQADVVKLDKNKYHVILGDASHTIELLQKDESGKNMSVVVDGKKQQVEIKDKYDALLKQLGMDKMLGSKMNLLKAPMPGLVLNVLVKEGDNIKKGDSLLVLEAMKMENNIKAAGDGVVKKVNVQVKQAVEKNQVLIEME